MKKARRGRKSGPKAPVIRSPIAGILDELSDDLLSQVYGWLGPPDLLAVARASKRTYDFVMDPERQLFDTAFERFDSGPRELPKRPEALGSLSLPQWTAFLWPNACLVGER